MMNMQMVSIQRYKLCVAHNASKELGITVSEAERIMSISGINRIIDSDPVVSLHYDPDEWIENVRAYILRTKK